MNGLNALGVIGGFIAAVVSAWLGLRTYQASQVAKVKEREGERFKVEAEAYTRARKFDDDVVARLTKQILDLTERAEKAEERAEKAEDRAQKAEERARLAEDAYALLKRRLDAAGIPETP